MLYFLKYLALLIISPAKGWEDIGDSDINPRMAFVKGLMPLIVLCGLSCVIPALYVRHGDLWQRVIHMAVTAGSYFVTYFIAMLVLSSFTGKWTESGRPDGRRTSLFISFNLSVLLLFNIIRNLIPDENALIDFLPVFDVLIMWKGASYLRVREDSVGLAVLLSIASILIPPGALDMLFESIIP